MAVITFEEIKSRYQNKLIQEQEVNCRLLLKTKEGFLVDINEEWEGFMSNNHFSNNSETELTVGFEFKALVISGPDRGDRYIVSVKALKEKAVWERLEKIKVENSSFKVTISKVVKGGVEVFIDGIRAFLPGRYIRLVGVSQDKWPNQEINVLIEELDYKEKKIILNHKKAVEIEKQQKAKEIIKKLNEGDIVEAPILRIADFGVFVDLGGLDGLIPASELSWGRFNHPREIVKVGQNLKARIFRIEKENLRVALSAKQLLGDPWDLIDSEWEIGKTLQGKVISEAPFGLFVELSPGIEALLHNTEVPENIEKPRINNVILVKIIKIDLDQRKIGLTLRGIEQEEQRTEDSPPEATLPLAEVQRTEDSPPEAPPPSAEVQRTEDSPPKVGLPSGEEQSTELGAQSSQIGAQNEDHHPLKDDSQSSVFTPNENPNLVDSLQSREEGD